MCIAYQHPCIFVASDEGYAECPPKKLETQKIASAVWAGYSNSLFYVSGLVVGPEGLTLIYKVLNY